MPQDMLLQPMNRSGPMPVIRLDAGRDDIQALDRLMKHGARIGNELPERDDYLNGLIEKPWGQEYRPYVDDLVDVWHLRIDPGQSTSVHAHPRKTTYLICLAGRGISTTLKGTIPVHPGTVLRIARGAFHATACDTDSEPLMLIEVETPRNKYDLVRMADNYNRASKQYEPEGIALPSGRRRHPGLPNASLCPRSPCGRFVFSIRTGMDVYYRGIPRDGFLIQLGIDSILSEEMVILGDHDGARDRISTDAHYLCIETHFV